MSHYILIDLDGLTCAQYIFGMVATAASQTPFKLCTLLVSSAVVTERKASYSGLRSPAVNPSPKNLGLLPNFLLLLPSR
jgi:hypothetical protein